jgi:hypothetical protein
VTLQHYFGTTIIKVCRPLTNDISDGNSDNIEETWHGEDCYITMSCIKLLENLKQKCEERWRKGDTINKFLLETAPNFLAR